MSNFNIKMDFSRIENYSAVEDDNNYHQLDTNLPSVLSEDHPLLQKFQQSLKEHLLRVQEQLLSEIADLDHNIKVKEQEREDVGAQLYDRQQELKQQNNILNDYEKQIKETSEKRINREKNLESLKEVYGNKSAMHKEAKRYHNERLIELSSLQALENNIEKWSKEIENDVETAKRVVSKDWQDQQMISEEKKKMDLLLFNIDSEVRKREQELNSINEQIKDQNSVIGVLNKNLSDATADLDVLQQEHKRLAQAWNEVIIAIQHRDRILFQVKESLRSEREKYKVLTSNIEAIQKSANKEMRQHEKFESFRSRIFDNVKNMEKQVEKELKESSKLAEKLDRLNNLLEQTEDDFRKSKSEGNILEVQLRSIQSKLEKHANKKIEIEEKILDIAQNQITADKASEHRMKLLRDTQNQRRNLEITLSQLENQVSTVLLDLEKWKGIVLRLKEDSERLDRRHMEEKTRENKLNEDMKCIQNTIYIKMKQVDQLSKKLDNMINILGGQEQNPTDIKINNLDRSIEEMELEIREQQDFWLVLQGHVVNLADKRSAQMNEIQIARKQLMIIEQKTLKIESELEEARSMGRQTNRNIQNLNKELDLLSAKLFEKKKSHEIEELECQHTHTDLLEKLKDEEMSVLEMENEIYRLTKELEQAKEAVLDKHREALSWETKYKMAEETSKWRNEEKSSESEIGCMKAEIHRMEIRYNQLKRAQEKLVQDLEHCIMHREQIFITATTQQKMDGSQSRSRSTVQHKLNEVKLKLKQGQNEIGMAEKNLAGITNQYQQILAEVTRKQEDVENEKLQNNLIQAEIEQGMLLKHQNLENIIRKQHRAKRYRGFAGAKTIPKCKNEGILGMDLEKQREINDNLIDILQNLLNDFPEKKYYITRILQILRED